LRDHRKRQTLPQINNNMRYKNEEDLIAIEKFFEIPAFKRKEWIEHNRKVYEEHKEKIENDDFRWYFSGLDSEHFVCVGCGGYVTSMNFVFCGKNPEKVLCYKCQKVEKLIK